MESGAIQQVLDCIQVLPQLPTAAAMPMPPGWATMAAPPGAAPNMAATTMTAPPLVSPPMAAPCMAAAHTMAAPPVAGPQMANTLVAAPTPESFAVAPYVAHTSVIEELAVAFRSCSDSFFEASSWYKH